MFYCGSICGTIVVVGTSGFGIRSIDPTDLQGGLGGWIYPGFHRVLSYGFECEPRICVVPCFLGGGHKTISSQIGRITKDKNMMHFMALEAKNRIDVITNKSIDR